MRVTTRESTKLTCAFWKNAGRRWQSHHCAVGAPDAAAGQKWRFGRHLVLYILVGFSEDGRIGLEPSSFCRRGVNFPVFHQKSRNIPNRVKTTKIAWHWELHSAFHYSLHPHPWWNFPEALVLTVANRGANLFIIFLLFFSLINRLFSPT